MDYTNLRPDQEVDDNGLVFEVGSLYAYFQRVKDTRKLKGRLYPLPLLLTLMMLAKLGGEDRPSGIAEWIGHRIEQFYEMKILRQKSAPSHMTYRRVVGHFTTGRVREVGSGISPEEVERWAGDGV